MVAGSCSCFIVTSIERRSFRPGSSRFSSPPAPLRTEIRRKTSRMPPYAAALSARTLRYVKAMSAALRPAVMASSIRVRNAMMET